MNKFKFGPELLTGSSSKTDAVNFDINSHKNAGLQRSRRGTENGLYLQCSSNHLEQYSSLANNEDCLSSNFSGICQDTEFKNDEIVGSTNVLMEIITTADTSNSTEWYCHASFSSAAFIIVVVICLAFGYHYIRSVLVWLDTAEPIISVSFLAVMFFVICFPMVWGLTLLMVTAGYLYGLLYGPLAVIICVTLGLAISTPIMRVTVADYLRSFLFSQNAETIIDLVNGPHGMKVIALTRLTPVPFGLQNALFALSSVSLCRYVISSIGGLIPMTLLNCYIGSTFRNIQDLISDDINSLLGFSILGGQILMALILLWFMIRKARMELRKTMEKPSNSLLNESHSKLEVPDSL